MALDPNDPMQQALYPVPADLVWPPPEFAGLFTFAPEQPPVPDPLAVTAGEYGLPATGAGVPGNVPPPPPPPPPVKRFGGQPPIEETAAPVPGAPPPMPELGPAAPTASDLVDVTNQPGSIAPDPWAVLDQPAAPTDDQRLTQALEQHAGAPLTPESSLTPDQRMDWQLGELDDRQLAEYGKQDPEGFAAYLTRREERNRLDVAQRGADIAKRDQEARAERERIRAEAMRKADAAQAQLQQESDNLAADGGFWSSRTDGQKFLGLLSIGLGAFIAGPHGENKALSIWQRAQDQHIANAKRKLADKNSAIAKMYQRIGDDFLANEAMQQGVLKGEYAALASYEQMLDPRGTTVAKSAQRRLQISADIAASQQRARQYAEKLDIDRAKARADIDKTRAETAAILAKSAGRAAGVGGGTGTAIDKKVFTSDDLAKQLPPGAWVPPKGWTGTLRDYGQLADAASKGQQVAGGGAVGAEQRKTQRERVLPDVFNIDEKGNRIPFEPVGTDTEVADLRKRVAGTRKVVKMLDEALALRSGWTSNAGNSDENQRLKALMGAAKLAVKDADSLGQLTEGDLDLIVGRLGTDDFTQYRDFEAGVAQARKLLVDGARTSLVSQGLSPTAAAKWDVPNFYGAKHTTTPGEQTYKERQDQDKMRYGAEQARDPETGDIKFTGDLPAKPAPAYTLEADRLRRAKQARLWELEKEFGIGKVPRNAQGKVVDPKTGEVLE